MARDVLGERGLQALDGRPLEQSLESRNEGSVAFPQSHQALAQIGVGRQSLLDGGALVFVELPVDIGDEPPVLVILTHPSVPA